jgi:putative MATE family efflux protein
MVRLSAFMIMGFLTMTIAQLIEAVYLGLVGTAELAAIAFTFPLVMSLNAAVRGIGIGASSVVARVIGAGDRKRGAELTTHCLILVAAFAALCVGLGVPGARWFFQLLGAQGRVLELASGYIAVWLVGFTFFATSMVGTNMLRSAGNAAMPGIVMTVGSLLQVLIGPFLIFGWAGLPALGIEGAAWSFVIARLLSFALCMYWLAVKERMLVANVRGWLVSARQILHVGLPATASNLVAPLSTGIVTRLLSDFGHGVVAGFAVASRIEAVIAMVVIAVSTSVGPFVGQNWGAMLFDRVHAALRWCNGFCLAWGAASFFVMALCARWLVGMINDEGEVVETATTYLLIIPISLGFMGVMGVASACFNALGKPTPPLVLSLLRLVVVLIPLALIGRAIAGYAGVFVATAIANITVGILALVWNNHTVRVDSAAIRQTAAAAA